MNPPELLSLRVLSRRIGANREALRRLVRSGLLVPDFKAERAFLFHEHRTSEVRATVARFSTRR